MIDRLIQFQTDTKIESCCCNKLFLDYSNSPYIVVLGKKADSPSANKMKISPFRTAKKLDIKLTHRCIWLGETSHILATEMVTHFGTIFFFK